MSTTPRQDHTSPTTRWIVLLVIGLACGGVAGLLVLQTRGLFELISPPGTEGNGILTAEQMAQVRAAQVQADYKNVPLALGLAGVVVAGLLGLAAGGLRKCPRRIVAGLLTGCIGGGLLGALGGVCAIFVRQLLSNWDTLAADGQPDPLLTQLHTMALHLPTWICMSLAVGIAVGVAMRGSKDIGRVTGFALLGVLIASMIYPTLSAILFQMDDPDAVIPGGTLNLILWTTLNTGFIGLLLAIATRPKATIQPAPQPAAAA